MPLQIQNKKNIYESLSTMTEGEIIQGYKCKACNQNVDIEKKLAIKQLPNTLILHLNRIFFDFDKFKNVKLNDKLEFPNTLSMKDYMLESVLKS